MANLEYCKNDKNISSEEKIENEVNEKENSKQTF